MPSKNIASVLNNESNLRILDKLKEKPFYPRELAGEMGLSEPFVVRRLKAMEEFDVVESKWEKEGARRVKRYYLKDIDIKLGKDGLEVRTSELPLKSGIDIKRELLGTIIRLPLIIVLLYGIFFNVPVIVGAICIFFLWKAAIDYAFYKNFHVKTPLLSFIINLFVAVLLAAFIAEGAFAGLSQELVAGAASVCLVILLLILIYRSRFYQVEIYELFEDVADLMVRIEKAPLYVKAFYLPMVIKLKANEYFNLA